MQRTPSFSQRTNYARNSTSSSMLWRRLRRWYIIYPSEVSNPRTVRLQDNYCWLCPFSFEGFFKNSLWTLIVSVATLRRRLVSCVAKFFNFLQRHWFSFVEQRFFEVHVLFMFAGEICQFCLLWHSVCHYYYYYFFFMFPDCIYMYSCL